jgi:translation initiation factor eIF-2B subunit epsilon
LSGATLALLEKLNIGSSTSAVKLASSFKSKLVKWKWLFKKFCHTHEEEQSIILALEAAAVTPSVIGEVLSTEPSFRFILQTLHDEEVISDDAILRWAGKRRDDNPNTPKGILFLQQHTQDFLKWLEEDEDEEDDESDDDNDDDDDESEDDN